MLIYDEGVRIAKLSVLS